MVSTFYPTLQLQLATSAPGAASPTWQDISTLLVSGSCKRGRQFELDRIEAGTAEFVVLNSDRRFDPTYTAGPYYPNLLPLRRVRLMAEWQGTTYNLWSGYLESIEQIWPAKGAPIAFATLKCVDAFELMARRILIPAVMTATTSTGVTNGDLVFTSRPSTGNTGASGNANSYGYGWARPGGSGAGGGGSGYIGPLSVQFIEDATADPYVPDVTFNRSTGAITVTYRPGSAPTGRRAYKLMHDLNGDGVVSQVISTALAPGQNGQGHIDNYGPINLVGEYVQERSDLRIKRVLDAIGWSATDRVLRTGTATIAMTQFGPQDNMVALQHMQDVSATELGIVFMDGQNRVVFYDRNHRTVSPWNTSQATFTDDPASPNAYVDLQPAYDSRYLYNKITVTRNGGVAQVASDATSIAAYLTRELNISTIGAADSQSASMASAILARYKDVKMRYDRIRVVPRGGGSSIWTNLLGFDISTRITVKRTPPGAAQQWSQDCYIEAVAHSFDRHMQHWSTDWQLSPA